MRYAFYVYDRSDYIEKKPTRNLTLDDLFEFLTDNQARLIELKEDENDPEKIIIWSTSNIKGPLPFGSFKTTEKDLEYGEQYSNSYARKRFAEMPAIRISRQNYEQLVQQFEDLYKRKPKYLILREHDNGYVDMIEKDELSPEDIAIMNREYKIFQNYIKRWNAYVKAHPEKRRGPWRSPEDNEFESDFALYDPIDEQGVD